MTFSKEFLSQRAVAMSINMLPFSFRASQEHELGLKGQLWDYEVSFAATVVP